MEIKYHLQISITYLTACKERTLQNSKPTKTILRGPFFSFVYWWMKMYSYGNTLNIKKCNKISEIEHESCKK